jgi:uncharacterized membrane protein YgcG
MASHRRLKDSLSKEIKRAEERGRAAASAKTSSPLRPRTRSRGLPPSSDEESNVNESFGTPIGTPLNLSLNEEEPDETIMPLNPPLTTTPATTAATVVVTAVPPIAPVLAAGFPPVTRAAGGHHGSSNLAQDDRFDKLLLTCGPVVRRADRALRNLGEATGELKDAVIYEHDVTEINAGQKRVKDNLSAAVSGLTKLIDSTEAEDTMTDAEKDNVITMLDARLVSAEKDAYNTIAKAEEFLKRREQDQRDARQRQMGAKIPELPLRKFNGSGIRLTEFLEAFDANVGRKPNLTDANKLEYLIGCCTGEAHQLISQFRSTDANYAKARVALERRFGRDDVIIEQVYGEIDALQPRNKSPRASRELLDRLRGHLTTLENHGVKMKDGKEAAPLIAGLKTKLNKEAVVAWLRWCKQQPWDGTGRLPTMHEFTEFMDGELTTLLRYEHDSEGRSNRQPNTNSSRGGFSGGGATAGRRGFRRGGGGRDASAAATPRESTALAATSTPKAPAPKKKPQGSGLGASNAKTTANICVYCGSTAHAAANCPKARLLTPRERVIQLKNACFRCLSQLHPRRSCPLLKRACGTDNCREDHHPFLHGGFLKPT